MPWQCWVGFPCMGGSEKAEAREAARRPGRFQTRRASFPSRSFLLPATPRAPSAHSGSKKGWLDPRAASTAETLWSLHSLQTERGLCLSRTPRRQHVPPPAPRRPQTHMASPVADASRRRREKRRQLDARRSKCRIRLGGHMEQWCLLKERLGFSLHSQLAKFLLDRLGAGRD